MPSILSILGVILFLLGTYLALSHQLVLLGGILGLVGIWLGLNNKKT
jgi:hypothetical protein